MLDRLDVDQRRQRLHRGIALVFQVGGALVVGFRAMIWLLSWPIVASVAFSVVTADPRSFCAAWRCAAVGGAESVDPLREGGRR